MTKKLLFALLLTLVVSGCTGYFKANIGKMYIKIGTPYIAYVDKSSSAYINGLKPGDRIIEINGKKINRIADIYKIREVMYGGLVTIKCRRKLNVFTVTLRNGLSGIYFQNMKYPSTMGFVIYDIANALNRKIPYDYAAALAGDIFSPYVREDRCVREWNNAVGEQNIDFIGKAIGIRFTKLYSAVENNDILTDSIKKIYYNSIDLIRGYVASGEILVIHGGFAPPFHRNWGIADSIKGDTLFAYTVGCGGKRLPVKQPPLSVYLVRKEKNVMSLDSINYYLIKEIVNLYTNKRSVYGWKTGFEAYKALKRINSYKKYKNCMVKECNYDRFWRNFKINRQSENAFIYFSGLTKRKKIKKYLQGIMGINNNIIYSRYPPFVDVHNNLHIDSYLKYVSEIEKLDSMRIKMYKEILLIY